MNAFKVFPQILNFLRIAVFATALISCRDDDDPPAPEVININPSSAKPGTLVSIIGKNFSPVFSDNKVTFNSKEALVMNASSNQLNVIVPADAVTGPVGLIVQGRTATNQPVFTVESIPSSITSVSPSSGGYNTVVTITGLNFLPSPAANVVTFNGVPATITSATTTSLTVNVPARSGT